MLGWFLRLPPETVGREPYAHTTLHLPHGSLVLDCIRNHATWLRQLNKIDSLAPSSLIHALRKPICSEFRENSNLLFGSQVSSFDHSVQ